MVALDDDAREYLARRRTSAGSMLAGALTPEALRAEERDLRDRYGHGPEMHSETVVPQSSRLPRHYILDPYAEVRGTILYIHGGGWVMGEPEDYLAICRALARATGFRVVVTDYAKAPERPFPAGYNECLSIAWHLLRPDASNPEASPGCFVIAGDSAGGNLAAAVTGVLSLKSPGLLLAQVLVTPVLDSDLETSSYQDPDRQLSLTRDHMVWFFNQYASPHTDRADPRMSPLRAPCVSQLPPTLLVSAGTDVLASEIDAYHLRLKLDGVEVRRLDLPGQMHGFFQLHNVMVSSDTAIGWIADQLYELSDSSARRATKGQNK